MSRTITAMFDSRSEAEAARDRLCQSQIDPESVKIVDQSQSGSTAGSSGGSEDGGFWSSVKEAFLPSDDRYAYEEGIRRGGYLVCARVDEDRADAACRILEQSGSIDFDQRQQDWRAEGWQGFAGSSQGTGQAGFAQQQARSGTVEEERIPIVEEELRVGKREVARGGARVRSYVEETPVHEQVSLREENVSVERRPVDQTLSARDLDSGDLLREREIEMTERSEEAVVGKEARVREELVVKKTVGERTENIDDSVRHTEVEVDEGRTGQDRPAFGFSGDSNANGTDRQFDPAFERDRSDR